MLSTALSVLLVGYLPGVLAFRSPGAGRSLREALPAEERLFWSVVRSLAFSSAAALGLAAIGVYRFEYLLWLNAGLSALMLGLGRTRLRLTEVAPRPSWTAAIPVALIGLSCRLVFYVPPSEYVIGGKDPGTYFNEGIQIAQRGSLTITDPLVASIPVESRDLYIREVPDDTY